jgi:outer membrane lipoprotein
MITERRQATGRNEMREKKWLLGLLISLFAGCAPAISQEVLRDVNKDLSFQAVLRSPDEFKGKTILLGGKIIETTPLEGKTRITVLQYPLGFRDKPSVDTASEGRFILVAPGFLDPVVYSSGRQVTVAGIVDGKEVLPLGEINYTYPVVVSREVYLWPFDDAYYFPQFYICIGIGKTF